MLPYSWAKQERRWAGRLTAVPCEAAQYGARNGARHLIELDRCCGQTGSTPARVHGSRPAIWIVAELKSVRMDPCTGGAPRMILGDNETRVDLLNNEAIAKTIITLLREQPSQPATVGVHGDWGAGKSSILEMIEAGLDGDGDILCLTSTRCCYASARRGRAASAPT
jgi:hypothetical protein